MDNSIKKEILDHDSVFKNQQTDYENLLIRLKQIKSSITQLENYINLNK